MSHVDTKIQRRLIPSLLSEQFQSFTKSPPFSSLGEKIYNIKIIPRCVAQFSCPVMVPFLFFLRKYSGQMWASQKQMRFFKSNVMKQVFTTLCLVNRAFFFFFFFIAMVHMAATLKGLNKPDLIKLVLQLKSEMNSDIKELTSELETL